MKAIAIVISCCLLYLLLGSTYSNNINNVKVPDEAIRFRVISNSNVSNDQNLKLKIKFAIEKELSNLIKDNTSYNDINNIINSNINNFENIILKIMNDENNLETYHITYGENYFPEKEYNGIKYESGNYNSLVITLGNGLGNNWWCILFPPLCLLDMEDYSEYEYKLYVKEVLDKYL